MGATTRDERIAFRERNPKWKIAPVRIEMAECINCDACLRHCPPQFGAIFNHGPDVIILPELCSGCGKCLPACPVDCIYDDPAWESPPEDWWEEPNSPLDPYLPSGRLTIAEGNRRSAKGTSEMTSPTLPGAEPWSAEGTSGHGALVLHGFTGNPSSMRSLAEALHEAGFSIEMPLLPGHGTSLDDMLHTGWADWSKAAEDAYDRLAARVDKVVITGLSMGGTLSTWLATRHPESAGLAVINPYVEPPADSFIELVTGLKDAGNEIIPAIGSDIAMPGVEENAYQGTPIEALLSLFAGVRELSGTLGNISCPTLVITSKQDHVVPPSSSDLLAESVSGPVERMVLEKSFHVATQDYEAAEVEERIAEFARKVTA